MGADTLLFLRRFLQNPLQVSAVAPSSRVLARAMAAGLGPASGRVVEFGPGTGRLTEAILQTGLPPANLTCIELDPEFALHIAQRFPGVEVIRGGADRARDLVPPGAERVVSGLPLLSMPQGLREAILMAAADILAPGGEMVQFTYGMGPALTRKRLKELGLTYRRGRHVMLNTPPARVYYYRRG